MTLEVNSALQQTRQRNWLTISIKNRLVVKSIIVSTLVALIAIVSSVALRGSAIHQSEEEVVNVAGAIATDISFNVFESGGGSLESVADLETYVKMLHTSSNRDIAIVDANKIIKGDINSAEVGTTLNYDTNNEVGQTLVDGTPRLFSEKSAEHPDPIRVVVVPIRLNATIIGAILLDYTALYKEHVERADQTIGAIIFFEPDHYRVLFHHECDCGD